jgi:hypothetical protein
MHARVGEGLRDLGEGTIRRFLATWLKEHGLAMGSKAAATAARKQEA